MYITLHMYMYICIYVLFSYTQYLQTQLYTLLLPVPISLGVRSHAIISGCATATCVDRSKLPPTAHETKAPKDYIQYYVHACVFLVYTYVHHAYIHTFIFHIHSHIHIHIHSITTHIPIYIYIHI